jgi:replicative DNA helicase
MTQDQTAQLPKDSYRALLHRRANGLSVDEFECQMWRREEELIRCAIDYATHFKGCSLKPQHFAAAMHSIAWEAILQLVEKSPDTDEIDTTVLLSYMRRLDDERCSGHYGHQWLIAVMSEPPVNPSYALQDLVAEVTQHHRLRLWGSRFSSLRQRVGADTDLEGLQADFVNAGMDIAFQVHGEGHVDQPLSDFEWDPENTTTTSLVRTGIDPIDRCSGGGHGRGEMLVWGGGTGHGKSYGAQSLLRHQGRLKQRVLYISCEDSKELMFCRTIADLSEPAVSPKSVRMKKADPEVVGRAISRLKDEFADRVHVVERKKPTIGQVLEVIRRYRYVCEIDLVIVDYLQAITEDEPTTNKVQEMSSVTSKLKRCFTECNVAGIVFSQYSRESYKAGTEPGINACKYCGDIENEAEIMVLMWKDPEGKIHAKLPKVKWSSTRDQRYVIPVHPVTGCHQDWEEDYTEEEDDE